MTFFNLFYNNYIYIINFIRDARWQETKNFFRKGHYKSLEINVTREKDVSSWHDRSWIEQCLTTLSSIIDK